MAETENPRVTKEQVSLYLYFGTLYYATVGLLYLVGYWNSFGINVLQYLTLADALKGTAVPVAYTLIVAFAGITVGHAFATDDTDKKSKPPSRLRLWLSGKLKKHFDLIYIAALAVLTIVGPVEKWYVLPLLMSWPFAKLGAAWPPVQRLVPQETIRSLVLFLLSALPAYAFGVGKLDAASVLEGAEYRYIVSPVEGADAGWNDPPGTRPRLIGQAGDYQFVLLPDLVTISIGKIDTGKPLVFRTFKKPSPQSGPWSPKAPV